MRPVALFQHDRTQQPGLLLEFLEEADIPVQIFFPENDGHVPVNAKDYSGIVLLGSQRCVNDPLPWIHREMALVHNAFAWDIPVLGHCFGGQLMAKTLGAPVRRNVWPNIGWSALRPTPFGSDLFGNDLVTTFNWHYDTFAIPQGAQRLLFGQHCINKGFRMGCHLAFQCHFEVTEDIVRQWCQTGQDELRHATGPAVQPVQTILEQMPDRLPKLQRTAKHVYRHWSAALHRNQLINLGALPRAQNQMDAS